MIVREIGAGMAVRLGHRGGREARASLYSVPADTHLIVEELPREGGHCTGLPRRPHRERAGNNVGVDREKVGLGDLVLHASRV